MNSFYLTLPSNVDSLKTNKQGNYRTTLPQTLCLPGEWECGLVEFTYPYSWVNFGDKDNKFSTMIRIGIMKNSAYDLDIQEFNIPFGQYDTVAELLDAINENYEKFANIQSQKATEEYEKIKRAHKLKVNDPGTEKDDRERAHLQTLTQWLENRDYEIKQKLVGAFKVVYDNQIKKIRVKMNKEIVAGFSFSQQLRYILGDFDGIPEKDRKHWYMLGRDQRWRDEPEIVASYPPDLKAGIQTMFIYSDIVKPTIIGNTMAHILRTCPVQGKFSDVISKTFDRPHYVPVALNSINSIEINIKDHLNNVIEFAFGTVIIKLHFRKDVLFLIDL